MDTRLVGVDIWLYLPAIDTVIYLLQSLKDQKFPIDDFIPHQRGVDVGFKFSIADI